MGFADLVGEKGFRLVGGLVEVEKWLSLPATWFDEEGAKIESPRLIGGCGCLGGSVWVEAGVELAGILPGEVAVLVHLRALIVPGFLRHGFLLQAKT